mgnify:CR=1 FL=1
MKMSKKLQFGAQTAAMVVFLAVACANGQTATHFYSGYVSPGTITITNTFTYPAGSTLVQLMWWPLVPDGWTITNVRAPVGTVEMGWDGIITWLDRTLPASPVVMYYDVVVPAGETGPQNIEAAIGYDLGPELVWISATPDPLELNNLNKTLQIISPYGTGTPPVGVYTNLADTVLSLSMTPTASSGPTQYVCTGWSMTGQEPTSGTGTSFQMTVTNDAVLTWIWQQNNIAPSISEPYVLNAWRTTINGVNASNTISEAVLVGMASDPDGDTLSLASIALQGTKGGSLTRDEANHTLTYTPPAHTDAITETFSYEVSDGEGGVATGTLSVNVGYGGTLIRAF